jgi:hypothetical protein
MEMESEIPDMFAGIAEALKEATQDLLASADDTGCTVDLTLVSADALTSLIDRDPGMVLSLQMY